MLEESVEDIGVEILCAGTIPKYAEVLCHFNSEIIQSACTFATNVKSYMLMLWGCNIVITCFIVFKQPRTMSELEYKPCELVVTR